MTFDSFRVTSIDYDQDGNICQLTIINTKSKKTVFEFGPSAARTQPEKKKAANPAPEPESASEGAQAQPEEPIMIGEVHWIALKASCKDAGMDPKELLERYQVAKPSEISMSIFKDMMNFLGDMKKDFEQTGLPFQTPA